MYVHVHKLRKGEAYTGLVCERYVAGFFGVTGSPAVRAGNSHVRKELDIQADNACAVTARTAQGSCIVGKIPCLAAVFLCGCSFCIELPEFIVDAGVGGYGGTDIDAYGCSINKLHMLYAVAGNLPYMFRKPGPANTGIQGRNKAFKHHGCLA